MPQDEVTPGPPSASRRVVLASAGAAAIAALGGCTTYEQNPPSGGGEAPSGRDDAPTTGASSEASGAATPQALAQTSEIPVGGGRVFDQRRVVITQPQAGTFKAFSAVCTHQGCVVAEVKNGTINCPCHGSAFRVADGSVAKGPATRALKAVDIAVEGADIRLA